MFFHSPALVSCGGISFSGAVTLAVRMILYEGIFFHLVFFYPFFSSLSSECREGSAEGLSLLGGRPARISSGLFCSLWSVSTCSILRPLAQLPVPHRRGHKAIAAFSGLNLRPGSEKTSWTNSPEPLHQTLSKTECSSLKKIWCFLKSDQVKEV